MRYYMPNGLNEELGTEIRTTLEYAAPEVLAHNEYSTMTDIWSIGVVAFALLTGEMPFFEEENKTLMDKIEECKWRFELK